MNLLIQLRFLRPLRSLLLVALYVGVAGSVAWRVLALDAGTAWFIALAVTLPMLLGILIAGAAHEPMHRPFALVLPGLRQRQRKAAAVSLLVGACGATCAVTWWGQPAVSPVATFGLVCALIALPCIDRHQLIGNQAAPLAAFLGWLLVCKFLGPNLALAMNAAPWIFLLVGLSVGMASLARGFSRAGARARADTLFITYQTMAFSFLLHRGMVEHWQGEVLAQRSRQGKGPVAPGRDWTVRTVGRTSLDWMRVFWHAKFGVRKGNSVLRMLTILIAMIIMVGAVLPGVAYFFGQKDYWGTLAQCAAPDMNLFTGGTMVGIGANFLILLPAMALLCTSALASPQLAYPISRARLAEVVFWQAVAQWAVALVVPAASLFLASLLGQFMSGQFRPGYGLPALLAADLPLAVLLPLFVAAGTARGMVLRVVAAIPLMLALFFTAFSRPSWSGYLLTLPGMLGVIAATAVAQWLLWHRLHREYATADLPRPSAMGELVPVRR